MVGFVVGLLSSWMWMALVAFLSLPLRGVEGFHTIATTTAMATKGRMVPRIPASESQLQLPLPNRHDAGNRNRNGIPSRLQSRVLLRATSTDAAFDVDTALFCAGLAFDAYVEPDPDSSRWERGVSHN